MRQVWVATEELYGCHGYELVGVYTDLERAKARWPEVANWEDHFDRIEGSYRSFQHDDDLYFVRIDRLPLTEGPPPA